MNNNQQPVIEIGRLFDREPPHALEMEVCLLGSIVLDPTKIAEVKELVPSAEMFYAANYGALYEIALETFEEFGALDAMIFYRAVRDMAPNVWNEIGGEKGVIWICQAVPTATNAAAYARVVREKWRLRRLAEVAGNILHGVFHSPAMTDLAPDTAAEVSDRLVEKAIAEIGDVAEGKFTRSEKSRVRRRLGAMPGVGGMEGAPVGVSAELERLRALSGMPKVVGGKK